MEDINEDQNDVLKQFEILLNLAGDDITETSLFKDSLKLYQELIRLRQVLLLKEIKLRQESFQMQ